MNKIYDSIDEIHMDKDKKNAIQANIVKEYEKRNKWTAKLRRKTSWGTAAAAILGVLVLLGGSTAIAGAVFHFDLNNDFRSYFGLNEQEDKRLQEENVIQSPKICDEHNGVTVEAEKVVPAEKECFVWLKITVPEDMRPMKNPVSFVKNDFYQNNKSVQRWSFSYVYKEHVKPDASDPWKTIVWHPEDGITYMQITLDRAAGEETWEDTTLQLKFSELAYNGKEITTIDTESIWNLEIPVVSANQTVRYNMEYTCPLTDKIGIETTDSQNILITGVTVHPFSIGVEFKCPQAWKEDPSILPIIGHVSGYEKRDGSVVSFDIEEGSYPNINIKEDGTCEMYNMYDYMEVKDITAIFLDGQKIPLK